MRVIVVTKPTEIPHQPVEGKPTVVYWNIIGLVQSIRLALTYAGVDFCDVRIDAGSPADTENYKQTWFHAKPGLANVLHFPNLPYFLDDKVAISQSDAILRHVGRTYSETLMGAAGQEHVVDMVLEELKDHKGAIVRLAYGVGGDALLEWYKNNVPSILAKLDKLLADKDFLTGAHPSIADFQLYVFLYELSVIQQELGNDATASIIFLSSASSKMSAFMTRIEQLPKIKEYMAGPQYMKRPLNNPHAKFK